MAGVVDRDGDDVAPAPPAGRRHPWRRRVAVGTVVVVVAGLLSAVGSYGYLRWRLRAIHRQAVPSLGDSADVGAAENILLVGSDSRAGLTGTGDANAFGTATEVKGARSDSIMIVHLDPATRFASILSIPRDLWVDIPGQGKARINTAFTTSPDLLVQTITQDLGITIDHYVNVDFDSFRHVVDAMGGVKFWYPEPVRDNDNGVNDSGLDVQAAGCYTLDGGQALSLVRTRHLEYQEDGVWKPEHESDLARIRRQQLFVRAAVRRAESTGLAQVRRLPGVVGSLAASLTVDQGLSTDHLISLARRYRSIDPSAIRTTSIPTTEGFVGPADVLFVNTGELAGTIAAWQTPPAPPAAPVTTTAPVGSTVPATTASTAPAPPAPTTTLVLPNTGAAFPGVHGTDQAPYGSGC